MDIDKMSNIIKAMAIDGEEFIFNEALCGRTRRLREEKNWTAEQMATALGIPADRYRKYESRSPMPQYLIPRFALIVDRSVEYILTGRETKILPMTPQITQSKRKA